jgi:23S rRNA pseudouridine1911/1915/1917 synthase
LVHAAAAAGRPATSHARILARRLDNALVEVRIDTGRSHQIRIHLAAAGHPLAGDPLYVAGGVPARDPALPGEGGYLLHAHRLALAHPATGRPIVLEAPLPPELVLSAPGSA